MTRVFPKMPISQYPAGRQPPAGRLIHYIIPSGSRRGQAPCAVVFHSDRPACGYGVSRDGWVNWSGNRNPAAAGGPRPSGTPGVLIGMADAPSLQRRWPIHGWIGLGLVLVFWTLDWSLRGLRTQWAFFPLWLGYCLLVDALAWRRTGTSLLARSRRGYAMLFLLSIPGWWLFELLNLRTQNWRYDGAEHFTSLEYFALCSLSFSTVMPAVFGTAELVGSFAWLRGLGRGPRLAPTRMTLIVLFLLGWLMLGLLLACPRWFFPLMWLSVYLILEPINTALGNRSLLRYTAAGDWRPHLALSAGCLICGFCWEMWNYWSYPKWFYHVPLFGFLPVFEMPVLGYLGYLVFAWELFALYHLLAGKWGKVEYVQVCTESPV